MWPKQGPLHPATVHFPLAFLLAAFVVDLLRPFHAQLSSILPPALDLQHVSYLALSLGLLAAVPSVISGIRQADIMFFSTPNANVSATPKGRTTIAHAASSYIVVAGSAWSWWTKRKRLSESSAPVSTQQTTTSVDLAVAGVLCLVLTLSATLGHQLVYQYGAGFGAARAAVKKA